MIMICKNSPGHDESMHKLINGGGGGLVCQITIGRCSFWENVYFPLRKWNNLIISDIHYSKTVLLSVALAATALLSNSNQM